ncbi:glycosyltransferase family 2 protein [Tepidibacillus marianensis]|uniref:glycosyltransferase family 2 protein n=1 Tax=Tepidibacillus marianensis TaxID=3131995 RepID=UPI0030CAD364
MDLSVCVPVYNNKDLFQYCLESIGNASEGFENRIEVVISDNASKDNILGYVERFKNNYPKIKIKFNRNERNKGLAFNFHKVVKMAEGEFCWIIGSDDFILKNSISSILNIIDENPEIYFISVGIAHLYLNKVYDDTNLDNPYHRIPKAIEDNTIINYKSIPRWSGKVDRWDKLVNPIYRNVMMGSMMTGIFRRTKWISVDIENMDMSNEFTNVENTYPHCVVYAQSMIGRPAYYFGETVIVVGEGAREWMGKSFWSGSLALIYLKILNEIVDSYKVGGLNFSNIVKCRMYTAYTAGTVFIPFLFRRFILRRPIKNQESIGSIKVLKRFWYIPTFYIGVIRGVIRSLLGV